MLQIVPAPREVPDPDIGGDRGHAVHALICIIVEQQPWILDIPDQSSIKVEISRLVVLLGVREQLALDANQVLYHWVLQAVTELVLWLRARNPQKLVAEPRHPVIQLDNWWKLSAKCPDLRYITGAGQLELSEIKTGAIGEKIGYNKLLEYGIAELLVQHRMGNPIKAVQLRWLNLYTNIGNTMPDRPFQPILSVYRTKMKLLRANRYLRKLYNRTFEEVLAEMPPIGHAPSKYSEKQRDVAFKAIA